MTFGRLKSYCKYLYGRGGIYCIAHYTSLQCTTVNRSALVITESKNEMNCKSRHKLIHKCQDLDFYFLLHSYKLKSQNVVMYAASISTMQILKIYGVLKYIANISGLTAFAASSMSALVRPPPSLSFHVYLQVVPLENASAHSSHA